MNRIALSIAFLIGGVASASAACVSPAVMHDFPGTAFSMSLATAPDTNCQSNIAVPTWAGGTLGAMANYGTSPGAVLVPGVNAFITNTPAVTQSGTWTVQPGNTANTTPWLVNGTGASGAALAGNPFRVGLSDGTNSQNWLAAIALADGVNGNNTGAVVSWLWNGTTYDRQRGDLTNGAFVNVKTSVLPTGGSTSANQTSQITQETATATGVGAPADTAWVSGSGSIIAVLKNIAAGIASLVTNTAAPIPAQSNHTTNIGAVDSISQYPGGAVPLTASATGTTAATTATLAGAVGKTTYICSLSVRANATANTNVTDTVTGVITGTLSRALWVPANTAGLGVDEQIYSPCVPASTTNTAIAVVSGAPGTGGVVTVNATGYQL